MINYWIKKKAKKLEVSRDLRHTSNLLQNTIFDLLKPHVLSAEDNIREKKKRPDVDSIFNHIAKSSATNIESDVVESVLGELINQKIISNKKTSSSCNSFYRAEKSDNNSNILENSSKNQANLDAIQISLKDPVPRVNIETRQSKHVIQNKNKPEEEINALKFEAQLSALKSYMNWELSTMNNKLDAFSQCLIKNASCQSNNENKNFDSSR